MRKRFKTFRGFCDTLQAAFDNPRTRFTRVGTFDGHEFLIENDPKRKTYPIKFYPLGSARKQRMSGHKGRHPEATIKKKVLDMLEDLRLSGHVPMFSKKPARKRRVVPPRR